MRYEAVVAAVFVLMPAAILNGAINTALADVEYRKQMADVGIVLVGGTPQQLRTYLADERRKWSEVIHKRGFKVD